MIKIIPWADRKLSMKNWRKIWNLFPYGEICMTEIPTEWEKQNWAEKVARYYVARGREFSVEINPVKHYTLLLSLLEIGVRKFYFLWRGIQKDCFLSSFSVVTIAQQVLESYQDVTIIIVYALDYTRKNLSPDIETIKTSIYCACSMTKEVPQIQLQFRYPHPWSGRARGRLLIEVVEWIDKYKDVKHMTIQPLCGCITILPNTCIYPCEYCYRKKRKKKFGNAERDKNVCGTIEKGIFRTIKCDKCYGYRRFV